MNKQQRLRCRIKQLEHENKSMQEKCKNYDHVHQSLKTVVKLYENRCKQDGYTDEQLLCLRKAVIKVEL